MPQMGGALITISHLWYNYDISDGRGLVGISWKCPLLDWWGEGTTMWMGLAFMYLKKDNIVTDMSICMIWLEVVQNANKTSKRGYSPNQTDSLYSNFLRGETCRLYASIFSVRSSPKLYMYIMKRFLDSWMSLLLWFVGLSCWFHALMTLSCPLAF